MRERLSWNKSAETEKKADPYAINQTRVNPPADKYGIPSDFAETPDTKTPWKTEGRTETGHPAPEPERQAVMAVKKLEDKALKCITIAQRMLPGGTDEEIELQATDLMYMPDRCVMATLDRQKGLAERIAAEEPAEVPAEGDDDDEKAKDKEAAAPAPAPEVKPEAKKEETTPAPEKKEVEAAKVPEKKEEVPAPVVPEKKEEPITVEASENDLLDMIFAAEETKIGAKKLSGIVKQASSSDTNLESLWNAPPDISKAFK